METKKRESKISEQLFARAQKSIPGGVNSPVRAFKSVGGIPRFIKRAQGAYLWDEDNNQFVDYIGSWGPMIAGHSHPTVLKAIETTMRQGISFGAPTLAEVLFAETLIKLMPSLELIRMVSSGTEATMSALRLARGFTKRERIIKFEGCYHGHSDGLLVKAGSGLLTLGQPNSAGVPVNIAKYTTVLPYNDVAALKSIFEKEGNEIAAIIVEPIAGNMNLIIPDIEFLETMRALCTHYGSVLIFDEVMTGFRVHSGGAQELFKIKPDLTCLGKIIGGGLPAAAFGGRRDIMECLAPIGQVYQAGTLSGNPLATAAGLATFELISQPDFFQTISAHTKYLIDGLIKAAREIQLPFTAQAVGGMFGIYFSNKIPKTFADINQSNKHYYHQFFHSMLSQGHYFPPSAFEAGFISIKHITEITQNTINAAAKAFREIKNQNA